MERTSRLNPAVSPSQAATASRGSWVVRSRYRHGESRALRRVSSAEAPVSLAEPRASWNRGMICSRRGSSPGT